MSCMCLPKMKGFLKSLKNMLLNELFGLLPELPDLNALATLAAGQGAISALASMSARLSAAMRLGIGLPELSLDLVAKLEAMAMVSAYLGVNPLSASASAQLSASIGSINLLLPNILAELLALLGPLINLLNDLLALATTVQSL